MKVNLFVSLLLSIPMFMSVITIYDFDLKSDLRNWSVVDDVVMGGKSQGNFEINDEGHALFYGDVSLENNGGFSSVRYRTEAVEIFPRAFCKIRLKGDGKKYQFRIKDDVYNRYSYVIDFSTSGEWETIQLPLKEMTPSFRGMTLDMPNYNAKKIEEVAFLIANYKNESFNLEIDWIRIE